MLQVVTDYLHRINPVYRKRNGRWVIGSESRQRILAPDSPRLFLSDD